jgi:hypothetical protein
VSLLKAEKRKQKEKRVTTLKDKENRKETPQKRSSVFPAPLKGAGT